MTTFKIEFTNAGKLLTTENRKHETQATPSIKMIKNALHSVCLNNGIKSFGEAKALVYRNGDFIGSVKISK